MAGMVSIQLEGMTELVAALNKLPSKASQGKAMRPALRASTKRLRTAVVTEYDRQGLVLTGRTRAAFMKAKVRAVRRSRSSIGFSFDYPDRAEIGADADDKWYPPFVTEYGSTKDPERYPAFAPVRKAVNANEEQETRRLAADISKGIEKEWARLARKAKK